MKERERKLTAQYGNSRGGDKKRKGGEEVGWQQWMREEKVRWQRGRGGWGGGSGQGGGWDGGGGQGGGWGSSEEERVRERGLGG